MENKWRIIKNGYGRSYGIESTDIETFKKDPIASLAREICQNSIDAKKTSENKVIVEFHPFTLKKDETPGIDDIIKEVEEIKEFTRRTNNTKDYNSADEIRNKLLKDSYNCLRISDFNTTGLSDVNGIAGSFYYLTKGNGLSSKSRLSGGSKGVGKFASFVTSEFNTVFYSTKNESGEIGYLGMAKFGSREIGNTQEMTTGDLYYGSDEKNSPIIEDCNIDPEFIRTETGTDVYVIGFVKIDGWQIQIIKKILDSFMVSIMRDELEIRVDNILVNKDSVGELIDKYEELKKGNVGKSILAQYKLLTDPNVFYKKFNIDMYGEIEVYVKSYNITEREEATKKCVMVRYPLMKIKELKNISNIPCSALCIIPNNKLSEKLIQIENAQHTDWEYTRITDDPFKKKEYKNILDLMEENIRKYANEVLMDSDGNQTDLEGAGDLLPDETEEDIIGDDGKVPEEDVPEITITKRPPKRRTKPSVDSNEGDSVAPDIGDEDETGGDEISIPSGHNQASNGGEHAGDSETGKDEGDNDVFVKTQMSGLNYKVFMKNKDEGKFVISFNSDYNENDCEIEFNYLDDSDSKYNIEIYECKVNDELVEIENGIPKHFKINPGKTKIELVTNLREYYGCEVKLYANRNE